MTLSAKIRQFFRIESLIKSVICSLRIILIIMFQAKLKEIESSCGEMEGYIEDIKAEKARMCEEVIEAEKQVMLWERKIALEREMQQALDPSVG